MKAIMKIIKPKTCANIMNHIQSILVIKNKREATAIQKLIDENGYAEIYVYCSKNGGNLVYGTEYRGGSFVDEYGITRGYSKQQANKIFGLLNGKVLFKFRCYNVEEIKCITCNCGNDYYYGTDTLLKEKLGKLSCLTHNELENYLGLPSTSIDIYGCAIHISKLEIFDEPKELSEFYPYCKDEKCEYRNNHCSICYRPTLTKAPQSHRFIEVDNEQKG